MRSNAGIHTMLRGAGQALASGQPDRHTGGTAVLAHLALSLDQHAHPAAVKGRDWTQRARRQSLAGLAAPQQFGDAVVVDSLLATPASSEG
jgi:hypothetical protein